MKEINMAVSKHINRIDNWFHGNAGMIGRSVEVIFGIIWGADGFLKLQPDFFQNFSQLVSGAAGGQPQWLGGWFSFWGAITATNPSVFALIIAASEIAIFVSLTLGLLRKIGYGGGFVLSLLIWSVPEGFGGPYGPGATDIGTGIIYAVVFLLLAVISATYGNNKYTVDHHIEKRIKWWDKIAEIKY